MVLVDAVQENTLFEAWPDLSISVVTAGLDYMDIVGLTRDHKLSDSKWEEPMGEKTNAHHEEQAARELPHLQISPEAQVKKKQLVPGKDLLRGNAQRDQRRLYERGVKEGLGMEASA